MKNLSNLDKQVVAFEIMSQSLDEVKFEDRFYDGLIDELSIPKSPQTVARGIEIFNSIIPIKILRELSNKIRKRSYLSESEKILLINLTAFLKQFQFAKSLKKYFDEKVYSSIYLTCFDPIEFVLPDSPQALNDVTTDHGSCFITEIESSPGLSDLLKMETKKKIINLTKDLFDLNLRWNKILDEDNVDITVMEDKTKEMLTLETNRLCVCKSIFFDLNLKTKSAVTMLKEWINLFRKWSNNNVNTLNSNEYNNDLVKRVNDIKRTIEKLSDDIKTLENIIMHLKRDNQSLTIKENSLVEYINKKDELIQRRDSVNIDYETLLAKRSELIASLDFAINGTSKYEKYSREVCSIEEIINKKFMELKYLNYAVFLSQQDSDQIVTSLKDFGLWSESGHHILSDRERELCRKMNEKEKCEALLEEVYQNLYRLKVVVGSKISDISALLENVSDSSNRPVTGITYTIDESNIRFKDMNVTDVE